MALLLWAAGGLASTPADLVRWARALYGGSVLSAGSLRTMEDVSETTRLKAARPYGLGVQRLELGRHDTLGHSGRLGGYRSAMRYIPDQGVAIAVLTNQDRWDPDLIVRELLDVALPIEPGKPPVVAGPQDHGPPRQRF
jgi:CubicO group peptidase (beta-lactamase class C family)